MGAYFLKADVRPWHCRGLLLAGAALFLAGPARTADIPADSLAIATSEIMPGDQLAADTEAPSRRAYPPDAHRLRPPATTERKDLIFNIFSERNAARATNTAVPTQSKPQPAPPETPQPSSTTPSATPQADPIAKPVDATVTAPASTLQEPVTERKTDAPAKRSLKDFPLLGRSKPSVKTSTVPSPPSPSDPSLPASVTTPESTPAPIAKTTVPAPAPRVEPVPATMPESTTSTAAPDPTSARTAMPASEPIAKADTSTNPVDVPETTAPALPLTTATDPVPAVPASDAEKEPDDFTAAPMDPEPAPEAAANPERETTDSSKKESPDAIAKPAAPIPAEPQVEPVTPKEASVSTESRPAPRHETSMISRPAPAPAREPEQQTTTSADSGMTALKDSAAPSYPSGAKPYRAQHERMPFLLRAEITLDDAAASVNPQNVSADSSGEAERKGAFLSMDDLATSATPAIARTEPETKPAKTEVLFHHNESDPPDTTVPVVQPQPAKKKDSHASDRTVTKKAKRRLDTVDESSDNADTERQRSISRSSPKVPSEPNEPREPASAAPGTATPHGSGVTAETPSSDNTEKRAAHVPEAITDAGEKPSDLADAEPPESAVTAMPDSWRDTAALPSESVARVPESEPVTPAVENAHGVTAPETRTAAGSEPSIAEQPHPAADTSATTTVAHTDTPEKTPSLLDEAIGTSSTPTEPTVTKTSARVAPAPTTPIPAADVQASATPGISTESAPTDESGTVAATVPADGPASTVDRNAIARILPPVPLPESAWITEARNGPVQPGERLLVTIAFAPDATREVVVGADGRFAYLHGIRMTGAGLTPPQIAAVLHDRLALVEHDPAVTVERVLRKSGAVTVLGVAEHEGTFALGEETSLLDMANLFGWTAGTAPTVPDFQTERACLIRGGRLTPLALDRLVNGHDRRASIRLRDGDVVILPVRADVPAAAIVCGVTDVPYLWRMDNVPTVRGALAAAAGDGTVPPYAAILRGPLAQPRVIRIDLARVESGAEPDVRLEGHDIIHAISAFPENDRDLVRAAIEALGRLGGHL